MPDAAGWLLLAEYSGLALAAVILAVYVVCETARGIRWLRDRRRSTREAALLRPHRLWIDQNEVDRRFAAIAEELKAGAE